MLFFDSKLGKNQDRKSGFIYGSFEFIELDIQQT